jgi:tRNA threonylcarbamoyladenosine biosynthesis protein TsaE
LHSQHLKTIETHLPDETATQALGKHLSATLHPGLVIYLSGDLGAGKTTLIRALLRGLGYDGKVKSPTYTLVEFYVISNLYLYHFDFYRFSDPREWEEAGFREHFGPDTICLVEWPEKAAGWLPPADLTVRLEIKENGRDAVLEANSEKGLDCLSNLEKV